MRRFKILITSALIQIALTYTAFSAGRADTDRLLNIGPQYPFMMLRTIFEPDVGRIQQAGDMVLDYSFSNMNTYVMSHNSDKFNSDIGDPSLFSKSGSGYSVYFDGESLWNKIQLKIGIGGGFEFLYSQRSVKFLSGMLDESIENFHNTFDFGNQGRKHSKRDQFGIYVWDNAKQEMVYQLTNPRTQIKDQSTTLGLKLSLLDKKEFASSLSLKYNIFQSEFETAEKVSGSNTDTTFNKIDQLSKSFNLSLNNSSYLQNFSWHTAFSITFTNKPVFERGPKEVLYFFSGMNFQMDDWYQLIVQNLLYTSIFPRDENSDIGMLIDEFTSGMRLLLSEGATFELAFVENLTQGPQNIDIVFYSALVFVF